MSCKKKSLHVVETTLVLPFFLYFFVVQIVSCGIVLLTVNIGLLMCVVFSFPEPLTIFRETRKYMLQFITYSTSRPFSSSI